MSTQLARALAVLTVVTGLTACGDDTTFQFPLPDAPIEDRVFDLIAGPLDRPSAVDVVAGRGSGFPRSVRVDVTDDWDFVFAILDGEPVWLPRGFFDGLEPTSGLARVDGSFESVRVVPGSREEYEEEDPMPIEIDAVYAIRSRTDPGIAFPCRVFGKIRVLSIEGDPARATFELFWNRNCDDRNVDSSGT